ncbi:12427_t:CDS:2, partial [Entrophospora sp. SA101]
HYQTYKYIVKYQINTSKMFDSPLAQTQNAQNYVDIMVQIRKYTSELENDTPTIVAFGDQSAGKSSLMQRLTGGIPVPKGVGRCTATPFEIRMMQTQEPIRRISLRYVENSKRIATSPSEIDFCDILDMEHEKIEDKLREAQRYVLNPSIKVQDSPISDTLGNKDELMFTRNAICVTIGDPNQKFSLAMVDLPGIIRDNQENEDFVISLVKEYINKDTTILLPIFQATADIATQSAWKLAKEADPSGKRTVGVLTKIDQISDDEIKHKALANFVEGKGEHQLVNGVVETFNQDTTFHGQVRTLKPIESNNDASSWMQLPPSPITHGNNPEPYNLFVFNNGGEVVIKFFLLT